MNNLDKAYSGVNSMGEYSKKYFSYLSKVMNSIDPNEIDKMEKIFYSAREKMNTIFVAGNGGSASTASTFVNDVGFDVYKRSSNKKKIKIVSLNDNIPSLTAISNDISYDNIFRSQIEINFQLNDMFIVFSGSGNSKNLISAVQWIKKNKMGKTVGFLGFNGGKLSDICDHSIIIESKKGLYGPIEDLHLMCNHIISLWLQSK